MLAAGYDEVLDYRDVDFTRTGERFDVVLDARTDRSMLAYARSLRTDGRYVTLGGQIGRLLWIALFGALARWLLGRRFRVLPLKPNRGLNAIRELCDAGKLRVVLDRTFPLADTPRAIRRFGDARHTGKVVVSVRDE